MRHLAIFAKHWQPGQVKTRLAARFGMRAAAQLHRHFLETLLVRLAATAHRRTLVFAPEARRAEFAALAGNAWRLLPQRGGALGERLEHFLAGSLAAPGGKVVILGADSPSVPLERIEAAWRLLDEAPVVLGPSCDGGYYLLAVRGSVPPIFRGIAWGTDAVWRQTLDALEEARVSYRELPEWYDVDEPSDLERLRSELAVQPSSEPALARLRIALAELLQAQDSPGPSPESD